MTNVTNIAGAQGAQGQNLDRRAREAILLREATRRVLVLSALKLGCPLWVASTDPEGHMAHVRAWVETDLDRVTGEGAVDRKAWLVVYDLLFASRSSDEGR